MYSIIFNQSAKEINEEERVVSENSVGSIGYHNGKQWTLIFISHYYSLNYRYNCRSYVNFSKKPEDYLHDIKTGKGILVGGRDTPSLRLFLSIMSFFFFHFSLLFYFFIFFKFLFLLYFTLQYCICFAIHWHVVTQLICLINFISVPS